MISSVFTIFFKKRLLTSSGTQMFCGTHIGKRCPDTHSMLMWIYVFRHLPWPILTYEIPKWNKITMKITNKVHYID